MDETKKNSLLIVDDEKLNLKVLTHILLQDYTIYAAKDGLTAIEYAKEYHPDLILLDIIMPGMDGYEVITELKQIDNIKDIPVIFITGLNNSEDEEKGLALGAVDYINKPFISAVIRLRVKHQMQIINQLRAIERLSMVDQLTNIANRRSFDNRLGVEWYRAIREKTPISLLMIDVDKFKTYNDTYGHQQGDTVLRIIAEVFTNTLKRAMDFAARWGGEEFTILLPNVDQEGALNVAEDLRKNVENTEIPCANGLFTKVTISIGVNTEVPLQNSSVDTFISGADEALYTAKRTGRNRVCLFEKDNIKEESTNEHEC
jgi:diguanylate cyclase (GGDEF)-like protein